MKVYRLELNWYFFLTKILKLYISAFKSCHVNGGYGEKSSLEHVFTEFHGIWLLASCIVFVHGRISIIDWYVNWISLNLFFPPHHPISNGDLWYFFLWIPACFLNDLFFWAWIQIYVMQSDLLIFFI